MDVATAGDLALLHVWGSSPTDVYAVGAYSGSFINQDDDGGGILHYDGSTWSEVLREPDLGFVALWGSSRNDVYAGGRTRSGQSVLWHYGGTRWSALSIPSMGRLNAIWGSSSEDIYVVSEGERTPRDELWHFDGTTWTEEETDIGSIDLF